MLRQILSVASVSAVLAAGVFSALPASAYGTYKECIDAAGAQYAKDIKDGVPRDAAAAMFVAAIAGCKTEFDRH